MLLVGGDQASSEGSNEEGIFNGTKMRNIQRRKVLSTGVMGMGMKRKRIQSGTPVGGYPASRISFFIKCTDE